ncbi:MAG: NAD(+) synthase [Thermodesulfobacteriota bacterium]|nr:NAD(+) synthase [Thermodesulfobacteriota bacterium]
MEFHAHVLNIDPASEVEKICHFIKKVTLKDFKRRGSVVGLSGGLDSAVTAELCVRALGKERVLGLVIPEKESNPISQRYAQRQADKMAIQAVTVDITRNLESFGLYEKRNAIIRKVFPEFDDTFRFHITLPQNLLEKERLNYHLITIEDKSGNRETKRISAKDWLGVSACQNVKQRVRMIQLHHYAEKNNYTVAGTTNKSELMQGFFVKFGDGGVDMEPIAHLYKTQVFELARHLGVVGEIVKRAPSPDTYSLPVTDKEFYFCLDFELLDLLLYAYETGAAIDQVSSTLDLNQEQIERVFKDFRAKERATWHLRELPAALQNLNSNI